MPQIRTITPPTANTLAPVTENYNNKALIRRALKKIKALKLHNMIFTNK